MSCIHSESAQPTSYVTSISKCKIQEIENVTEEKRFSREFYVWSGECDEWRTTKRIALPAFHPINTHSDNKTFNLIPCYSPDERYFFNLHIISKSSVTEISFGGI